MGATTRGRLDEHLIYKDTARPHVQQLFNVDVKISLDTLTLTCNTGFNSRRAHSEEMNDELSTNTERT
jgi:hypothetical protein